MPVLISRNLVESCIFLNENHAHLRKKNIRKSISAFYHQIFFLSFDSNLSCKLQLTDLVMVSVACLASWQTILECFSRELWVRRKRKETLKWIMEN